MSKYLKVCTMCNKETFSYLTKVSGIWCKSCYELVNEFKSTIEAIKRMLAWRSSKPGGEMLSFVYHGKTDSALFKQSFPGLGTWFGNANNALSNKGPDEWLRVKVERGELVDPYISLENINTKFGTSESGMRGSRPAPRYAAPQSIEKL